MIAAKQSGLSRLRNIFRVGSDETEQPFATLLETAQVTHTEEVIDLE